MSKVQVETYEMGPRFSETVLNELDPHYSRRTVSLAASETEVPFGTVLARGKGGNWAPFKATAATAPSEETEAAASTEPAYDILAILLGVDGANGAPASTEAQDVVVLTGYCIVNAEGLVWDKSVTDKEAAIDMLEARGIIVKKEA